MRQVRVHDCGTSPCSVCDARRPAASDGLPRPASTRPTRLPRARRSTSTSARRATVTIWAAANSAPALGGGAVRRGVVGQGPATAPRPHRDDAAQRAEESVAGRGRRRAGISPPRCADASWSDGAADRSRTSSRGSHSNGRARSRGDGLHQCGSRPAATGRAGARAPRAAGQGGRQGGRRRAPSTTGPSIGLGDLRRQPREPPLFAGGPDHEGQLQPARHRLAPQDRLPRSAARYAVFVHAARRRSRPLHDCRHATGRRSPSTPSPAKCSGCTRKTRDVRGQNAPRNGAGRGLAYWAERQRSARSST